MRFSIPIELPSLTNLRVHWQRALVLKKNQKKATRARMKGLELPTPPLVVLLTRVGPRKLDDDNLQSACKHVRDEIAQLIAGGRTGQRDGPEYFTWLYDQRVGDYAVEVEITPR